MKTWVAGLCGFLLLITPTLAFAAEWVEAVPGPRAVFVDKTSLNLDYDTVQYWQKVTLNDQVKSAKLKAWEKQQNVRVSEYKVHVIENCKTSALEFQNLVLTDAQGQPLSNDSSETMPLFSWPSHVIPDTPGEVLHKFVCNPNSVAATSPADPKTSVQNEDDPLWNRPSYHKKLVTIGQKILNANGITEPIGFAIDSDTQTPNAYAGDEYGTVHVMTALFKYVDNDDELAGIVGHEIGHILARHETSQRLKRNILSNASLILFATRRYGEYPMFYGSQSKELEADTIGLDLVVKAGYNPNAIFTIFSKIAGETNVPYYRRSHPVTSKRLALIKKQIAAKYPQFLEGGETAAKPATSSPMKDEDVEALRRIQAEGKAPQSGSNPPATGTN